MKEVDDEHNYESKLDQLQRLLQHHHAEPVSLVVSVHAGEERVQVLYVVPSG